MNIFNNSSGFMQWQELFDENVSKAWKEESFSGLRNISMLLFCLAREIRKVHYDMHKGALLLKEGKSKNGSGDGSLIGSGNCKSQTDEPKNDYESVSKPSESGSSSHDEFGSIVISSETNSPEIKKKHRLKRQIKQGDKAKRILNSVSNLESLPSTSVTNASCITTENPNSHVETKPNPQVVHIPKIFQESNSTLDFSTVQSTPESTLVSNKQPIFIKQKRNQKGKQLSMVQMFSNNYQSNKTRSKPNNSDDSDRTLVILDNRQQHQQIDSVMDNITNMVSYINRESSRESINKSDIHNSNIDSIANDLTYLSSDDHIANNDASLNKTKKTDNLEAKENICANLNEFLAEAQSVTCQLEPEPVVRGKERQKLPGWSCKNCEKFYLQQGLNGNQVMTLIKCSKHRGYYKPREDTLPGYWDMDLTSQKKKIVDVN